MMQMSGQSSKAYRPANDCRNYILQFASSGEPADQGVSLLGVTFGMKKSDVRTMLGKPMYDNGDSFELITNL